MAIKIIYTPCKNTKEAESIAKKLVEDDLVSCVNIFPIKSVYKWKNDKGKEKLMNEKEVVLLCKISSSKAEKASAEIKKLHSYDCPAIVVVDADANPEFEKWVN